VRVLKSSVLVGVQILQLLVKRAGILCSKMSTVMGSFQTMECSLGQRLDS